MNIVIEGTSDKPIYQQIVEQISSQIIRGELKENCSLPPIRTAAKELRISIITVKKAWEELERLGFIFKVAGKGCFVKDLSKIEILEIRNNLADKQIKKHIKYYKNLGFSKKEIIELVNKYY